MEESGLDRKKPAKDHANNFTGWMIKFQYLGMFPSPVYFTHTGIALESGSSLSSSDKPYGFEQASCQVLYGCFFPCCGLSHFFRMLAALSWIQVDSQPIVMFEN